MKETSPIQNVTTPPNVGTDRRLCTIATDVIQSMKLPVNFINITTLSEYRKDAHTSIYTIRQGKLLTADQMANPAVYADCIHWCLPGLPDTWNEFLYTRIVSHLWHIVNILSFLYIFFFFFYTSLQRMKLLIGVFYRDFIKFWFCKYFEKKLDMLCFVSFALTTTAYPSKHEYLMYVCWMLIP